jgi:tetratricopeptide (TPR) repeat protein
MKLQTLFALAAFALVQACASKSATTAAGTAGSASAAMPADPGPLTCPDSSDTPSMVGYTISTRYRFFERNPQFAVPACFIEAAGPPAARNDLAFSDSTVIKALAMSDAIRARTPNDAANLSGRLGLLYRMGRYREATSAFDALVTADPSRATLANYRLALAATVRSGDAANRLRLLTAAARRFPTTGSITADYDIQRQIPRLRALIDTTHQILRLAPQQTGGYATLASIYGNLDVGDSAIYYTRRALQAGVPRNDVAPSLQSWIGVIMRKAQLLDAPDVWDSTLAQARRIDETLPTDASKHLLGLAQVNVAASLVRRARTLPDPTVRYEPPRPAPSPAEVAQHVASCRGLSQVPSLLEQARTAMNQGGSRFSQASVPAIQNMASLVAREFAELSPRCRG